jgi:hypothetical protein
VTGFYWTLTVMSTLGFGDITFASDLGRFFSIVVLLSGIIFLLVMLPFTFIQFFYAPWLEAQNKARAPRAVPAGMRGHVILTHFNNVAANLIAQARPARHPLAWSWCPTFAGPQTSSTAAYRVVGESSTIRTPTATCACTRGHGGRAERRPGQHQHHLQHPRDLRSRGHRDQRRPGRLAGHPPAGRQHARLPVPQAAGPGPGPACARPQPESQRHRPLRRDADRRGAGHGAPPSRDRPWPRAACASGPA